MSGHAELDVLADAVRSLCSHVSVRDDNGVPFLLAIDHPIMFSLEVRHAAEGFNVDFWRGPVNEDEFIRSDCYPSQPEALRAISTWLRGAAP